MKKTNLEEVQERLREAADLTWGLFTKLRDSVAAEESRIIRCAAEAAERLTTGFLQAMGASITVPSWMDYCGTASVIELSKGSRKRQLSHAEHLMYEAA